MKIQDQSPVRMRNSPEINTPIQKLRQKSHSNISEINRGALIETCSLIPHFSKRIKTKEDKRAT